MNDFDIVELDEIVAIEILKATYGIDVLRWNVKEIKYIIKLLTIALKSTKIKPL